MTIVTARICVSVDGFSAGLRQTLENRFGEDAMRLNNWMFETDQPGREADPGDP